MIEVLIASDHAGFDLKQKIIQYLNSVSISDESLRDKFKINDLGPTNTDSVDYPDYADLVAKKINLNSADLRSEFPQSFGILICGSGQGMAMRANKYSNIRAALVWNEESAKLSREHNAAQIICMGSRLVDHDLALKCIKIFLTTAFSGGRHAARVAKLLKPI